MANSPQEVLVACREHDVKAVALHVTDMLGGWHQLSVPVSRLTEESFEDGFAWSVNRGGGNSGELVDVLLLPQYRTAYVEPYADPPTLSLLCTMHDPLTREELPDDSRTIAMKAEKYAQQCGVADKVLLELGVEFFLFDSAPQAGRRQGPRGASQFMTTGETLDLPRTLNGSGSGFMNDDFRNVIMYALLESGVDVTAHRQSRSDPFKAHFELADSPLVTSADNLMIMKHVVKRLAKAAGKSATFMPLPQAGRRPAGMSARLSLLKNETCILTGSGYAGLSDAGLHAIGGILRHGASLVALTNSTTNSYSRLGMCEGGFPQITYSQTDLRAAVRIPAIQSSKTKCLEFRPPDAASNPYLAFAALLMAAIDGIQNKIHPGAALDPNPYGPTDDSSTTYSRVPASLEASLTALESDGEFLLRGDVFSADMLESWIAHKRSKDVQSLREQPHPHEIRAYYDA